MKYCSYCGNELRNEAVVCPKCGCPTSDSEKKPISVNDVPNPWLNLLAFFIPLAGFIMFIAMYSTTPKKASRIAITALISFIIAVVLLLANPAVIDALGF